MGHQLTTDNPRLQELVHTYNTQSPAQFLKNNLCPYVSLEHAQEHFLRKEFFSYTKGDFSYARNDQTLSRDIQCWTGICRLLSYVLKCISERKYGDDIKIQFKYSITHQLKKIWHIDYNKYYGQIVITAPYSMRSDSDYIKDKVAKACWFAFDTVSDMLTRFKDIASEEAYRARALTTVIDCAF